MKKKIIFSSKYSLVCVFEICQLWSCQIPSKSMEAKALLPPPTRCEQQLTEFVARTNSAAERGDRIHGCMSLLAVSCFARTQYVCKSQPVPTNFGLRAGRHALCDRCTPLVIDRCGCLGRSCRAEADKGALG